MKHKMTDKELGEKLIQVFAGYDAPVRSLVQEAARRLIDGQKNCDNCRYHENPFDEDLIESGVAGEAAPVVRGRWNKCDKGGFSIKGFMACSVCDAMIPDTDNNHYCMAHLHYCPKCGAKMDLEE